MVLKELRWEGVDWIYAANYCVCSKNLIKCRKLPG